MTLEQTQGTLEPKGHGRWIFFHPSFEGTEQTAAASYSTTSDAAQKSIDRFFEFLHWQAPDSLASRFGLEDTWLLGERIDTFAGWDSRLLLQPHVQKTSNLEGTTLLSSLAANAM